ncbi:MAG TPA: PAS domain S-box protein [Methylobacter sp.]
MSKQLNPMSVALLYAVFAALWIVASGNLLTFAVDDAALQGHIEQAKGLTFVAITSSLLYLLLKGWHRTLIDPANVLNADIRPLATNRLALLFAALVLIVPLIGLAITTLYGPKIEREAYANLEAIAKLKAEQIENWLDERQDDIKVLAASPGFVESVDTLIKQQTVSSGEAIQKQLNLLRTIHGYDSWLLLDTKGQFLLTLGVHDGTNTDLQQSLHQSLVSKQVQRGDLYRDETGNIHLDWVAPIFVADTQGEHAIAAVALHVTAQHFLFPLIQTWPTSSPSAETLLVRQDGESALFMNSLRHRDNTALSLRLPLTKPLFPAGTAILSGQAGFTKGIDYRDIEVLTAYRPVKGTNWYLIAKIDRHEVLAPLRELVLWVSLVALVAIVVISIALLMLWRQQQRAQNLALLAQKAKSEDELEIADVSLKESRVRSQSLIDTALDGVITMGEDGRVVAWNPQAEHIFHYSLEQALGREVAELIVPPAYRDAHRRGIARFIKTGNSTIINTRIEVLGMRADGSEFPMELSVSALEQQGGYFFSAYVRDIGERKKTEEALLASEQELRLLAEAMPQIVWVTKADGRTIYINQQWVDYTGLTLEESYGHGWNKPFHPDDRQLAWNAWQNAVNNNAIYSLECRLRRVDGIYRWWLVRGVPLHDQSGKVYKWFGTCTDIHEIKESEAALRASEIKLRAILNASPVSMALNDELQNITYLTPAFVKGFGYTLEDIPTLSDWWLKAYPDPEYRQWAAEIWQNTFEKAKINGDDFPPLELNIHCKNGATKAVSIMAAPIDESFSGTHLMVLYDITERKQAENRIKASEQKFRDIVNTTDGIVWEADATTFQFTFVSQKAQRLLGYPLNDWLKPGFWLDNLHPDDKSWAPDYCASCTRLLEPHDFEYRFIAQDGRTVWLHDIVTVVQEEGSPRWLRGIMMDITERKQADNELRIAATAFESHEAMLITDAKQIILKVNQAFTRITGYNAEEAIGNTPSMLKSGNQDQPFYNAMWESLNRDKFWEGEIWNRRKNGELYPEWLSISAVTDADNQVSNYVAAFVDITAIKKSEETIHHLAFYDPLTKLPNRRLLLERLQQALNSSTRHLNHGAILFIDLDNFKELNEIKGYDIGDLLLIEVAKRLQLCARSDDTVACLGGDDFVVVLEELSIETDLAASQAESIAEKIRIAISQPFELQGLQHCNASSIGISLFRDHEITVDELLKHADTAMYQAKQSGRNAIRFFDPATHAAMEARISLGAELRLALPDNQFRLHYQMQVDNTGKILGAEALIRWHHPDRGLVSPAHFIPLTEESGLIVPIGLWVLETACAQIKRWELDTNTRHLQLAVNVSALQFRQPDFVEQVCKVLEKTAINPGNLKLELTESLVLEDINGTIAKIQSLKKRGVHFSMDDFGTGYSSLSYLSRLPLDQLKIDQSFVYNIGVKASDAVIVQTIIGMAKNLDMEVIAEGVETEQQRDFLERNGCTHYQGYLFGKPVPLEEFEQLLRNA